MKHLIVTGDDFGRSHEVNEAIERGHEAGFLTQASLMVNEACAEEAVRIARRHPALGVGLHLTLCDGCASAPSAMTNREGRFSTSPTIAGLRYAFVPGLNRVIETEIRAQFERFCGHGLARTYWDGHAHLHLHPTVLRLTLPTAKEEGFGGLRLVREPGAFAVVPQIFQQLSRAALRQLPGLAYADRTFGLRATGRMNTRTATRMVENLPDGVSEFYFHPGAEPETLDYAALLARVEARGITLGTLPPRAAGR